MENHTSKHKILKHISLFTSSSLVQSIGQLFHSYFGARWLGPDTFGAWQGARIIQSYLSYASLGVGHAMHRDVPALRGKNQNEEIDKIKNCTWSFNILIYTFVSIILFIASYFINGNREFILSLRFVAILIEITMFNGFFNVWFKANNRFEVVSAVAVINGLANILTIYLIYSGKLTGFLVAKVISLALMLIYYIYKNDTHLGFYLNRFIIINEMKVGFPILLLTLSTTIFSTIDRILILNKLSFAELGLYSLSGIIFIPITVVFTSVSAVLYPRVTERFGQTNRPHTLTNMFKMPVLVLSHVVPFLIASLYIFIPLLVNLFLVKYEMGVTATQIVIWGIFFYSLVSTLGNVIIALNKQIYMVLLLGLMTLLNYVFGKTLIDMGFGINGVAVSSSLVYLLYFFLLYTMAYIFSKNPIKKFLPEIFYIVLPPLMNMGIVFLINYYVDLSGFSLNNILFIVLIIVALFILNFKFFKKALSLLGINSISDFKRLSLGFVS